MHFGGDEGETRKISSKEGMRTPSTRYAGTSISEFDLFFKILYVLGKRIHNAPALLLDVAIC